MELKNQDLTIIEALSKDCRLSNKEISKLAKITKETVASKITYLENEKIIRGYGLKLDYDLLGFIEYNLFIRLKKAKKENIEELINFLEADKNVTWIGKSFGNFDIKVAIIVKDHNKIRNFQSKVYSKFSESIDVLETLLLTDKHKASVKYMSKTKKSSNDIKKIQLEEIDKKILFELGQNARERLTKIGYDLEISAEVVKYRLDKLKKMGIVNGHGVVIDNNKLGKIQCLVLINISEGKIDEFKTYLKKNEYLTTYSQTIGPHNFNFTLSANSIFELYETLNDIRSDFSEHVRDFDFQIFFDFFKYPKMPKCLLE